LALPVLRDIGLLDVCRKFLTFAKEICYADGDVQHVYNAWGSATDIKRQWAPYLAGYRGMGEVHSGGPLIEDPAAGDMTGVNGEAWIAHFAVDHRPTRSAGQIERIHNVLYTYLDSFILWPLLISVLETSKQRFFDHRVCDSARR
ncbi:unnamed protein product, partial [Polarella glacialis]